MWERPVPVQMWKGQPGPGADVAGLSLMPAIQMKAGVSPVLVRIWVGEPTPQRADVAGGSPIPSEPPLNPSEPPLHPSEPPLNPSEPRSHVVRHAVMSYGTRSCCMRCGMMRYT
jgi:hypothetical protein